MGNSGNMYPGVETENPLLGSCENDCSYCYRNDLMWRFKKDGKGLVNHWKRYHGMPRLDPNFNWKVLGGKTKTIFVCSMTDIGAANVPPYFQYEIFSRCRDYPGNTYIVQTKNPDGIHHLSALPYKCIVAVTIETISDTSKISCAPLPDVRFMNMVLLKDKLREIEKLKNTITDCWTERPKLMISVEPVIDCDFDLFADWIEEVGVDIVSIGADTGNNNLPEPSESKLRAFVGALREFVPEVRIKKGLRRLWPDVEVT